MKLIGWMIFKVISKIIFVKVEWEYTCFSEDGDALFSSKKCDDT